MTKTKNFIQILLAIMFYVIGFVYILFFSIDEPRYDLLLKQPSSIIDGIITTLNISFITLIGSMILGFILFLTLRCNQLFIRTLAILFQEIILGTPLLVMLFLSVYVVGDIANIKNKFILGVSALILYMSPYLANSYATAIAIIDKNQYIIMDIYNFNIIQRYRYIIIPQMIRPLIPSLINQLSTMVKGSALLKIISISELSYVLTVISSRNWAVIEGYYVMWICYLLITIPLSYLAKYIGKRVSNEHIN